MRGRHANRAAADPQIKAANVASAYAVSALPLILLFVLPTSLRAEDYTYTTNGGAITITKYIGSGGAVTIPSTISGLPVTRIGFQAFMGCNSVTNVAIPDSITNIGAYTFQSLASHSRRRKVGSG